MDSTPLGKVLNGDNVNNMTSSKLGRKEIHQGEIRFWESIKLWEKREGY